MAQMDRPVALSKCPGCEEPLESGDLFCGACGYDLSAVPPPPRNRPTTGQSGPEAVGGSGAPPEAAGGPAGDGAVGDRSVPGAGGSVPGGPEGDAPGVDRRVPGGPVAGTGWGTGTVGGPGPGHTLPDTAGLRFDDRAGEGGDFELPAPRPAEAGQTEAGAPEAGHPHGAEAPGAASGHGTDPEAVAPSRGTTDQAGAGHPQGAAGHGTATPPEGTASHGGTPPQPTSGQEPEAGAPPQGAAVPDPRTVEHAPAGEAAAARVCVACRAGRVDADGYCENCGHAQPSERDHMERTLDTVAAVSDRGLRHHRNEDSFAVASAVLPDGSPATVAIVCDGVSSATRPDEASAAAAATACESLTVALPRGAHPQTAMHEAIVAAAKAVDALADGGGDGAREHEPHRHQNAPACTLVGAVVAGGLLVIGWVGDSRAYWVPDDRSAPAARLTEDDSWAAQMVAAGLMGEAEAYADERAHAITGWLGADSYELDPHTAAFKPDRPGVVVVCTDGLWNYAEGADEMARVLPADATGRPLHSARVLVGHALDGGGHDNVTVALLPFAVPPAGAGSA
ncbi:protein phosphatase 2C domain-containing protein [Streptomyces sp. NPDC046887]|uniref:protein phosphatase 2C domain-containing protein n=1 Tax=Streptomyces sp. NPDC046887 TaxID=3155472 RepID=UPI0033FD9CA0